MEPDGRTKAELFFIVPRFFGRFKEVRAMMGGKGEVMSCHVEGLSFGKEGRQAVHRVQGAPISELHEGRPNCCIQVTARKAGQGIRSFACRDLSTIDHIVGIKARNGGGGHARVEGSTPSRIDERFAWGGSLAALFEERASYPRDTNGSSFALPCLVGAMGDGLTLASCSRPITAAQSLISACVAGRCLNFLVMSLLMSA